MPGDTYTMPSSPEQATPFNDGNVLEFRSRSREGLRDLDTAQAERAVADAYKAHDAEATSEQNGVESVATLLNNLTVTRRYYLEDEAA